MNYIKLKKPIKAKVVNALPNIFGPCELKHNQIVHIQAVQLFGMFKWLLGGTTYYNLVEFPNEWFSKHRFISIR